MANIVGDWESDDEIEYYWAITHLDLAYVLIIMIAIIFITFLPAYCQRW